MELDAIVLDVMGIGAISELCLKLRGVSPIGSL